jgi:hypothetical protein
VPDVDTLISSELRELAFDAAREARPLPSAEVRRLGQRRRRRHLAAGSVAVALSVAAVAGGVEMPSRADHPTTVAATPSPTAARPEVLARAALLTEPGVGPGWRLTARPPGSVALPCPHESRGSAGLAWQDWAGDGGRVSQQVTVWTSVLQASAVHAYVRATLDRCPAAAVRGSTTEGSEIPLSLTGLGVDAAYATEITVTPNGAAAERTFVAVLRVGAVVSEVYLSGPQAAPGPERSTFLRVVDRAARRLGAARR